MGVFDTIKAKMEERKARKEQAKAESERSKAQYKESFTASMAAARAGEAVQAEKQQYLKKQEARRRFVELFAPGSTTEKKDDFGMSLFQDSRSNEEYARLISGGSNGSGAMSMLYGGRSARPRKRRGKR
jgi:RecG-like helicase